MPLHHACHSSTESCSIPTAAAALTLPVTTHPSASCCRIPSCPLAALQCSHSHSAHHSNTDVPPLDWAFFTCAPCSHLLQQEAGHGGLQELGDTLGGGVGAVGGTEGIVDVQVSVGCQLQGSTRHSDAHNTIGQPLNLSGCERSARGDDACDCNCLLQMQISMCCLSLLQLPSLWEAAWRSQNEPKLRQPREPMAPPSSDTQRAA